MSESSHIALQSFLLEFGQRVLALEKRHLPQMKAGLQTLMQGFGEIYPRWQEAEKRIASDYNLFSILNIRHLETRLHTPLLCNLLSPSGSHSQGELFLSSFFESIFPDDPVIRAFSPSSIHVTEELYAGEKGRIDIVIRHIHPENPYVVIIENKIFAPDQENQLERYYKYARALNLPDERIRLVYLTLWGTLPADVSWIEQENARRKQENPNVADPVVHCIAYRSHIKNWLRPLIDQIEAPVVKYTVQQYLQAIEYLTA